MKKTTPNFSKQLAKYSALSLSMVGAADASGQIEYTDITPDEGGEITYLLDMDNDGSHEFGITNDIPFTGGGNLILNNPYYVTPAAGAEFLENNLASPPITYPAGLANGDLISSGDTNWTAGYFNFLANYDPIQTNPCQGRPNAEFCGALGDQYLGLRFQIAGETHYGWARIAPLNGTTTNWAIRDYAYNTTPGESINAGQTTLSLDDNALNENVSITAFNKTISVSNLNNPASYQVFDILGKQIMSGTIENSDQNISANNTTTGIYIVKITDLTSNATTTKKIVL